MVKLMMVKMDCVSMEEMICSAWTCVLPFMCQFVNVMYICQYYVFIVFIICDNCVFSCTQGGLPLSVFSFSPSLSVCVCVYVKARNTALLPVFQQAVLSHYQSDICAVLRSHLDASHTHVRETSLGLDLTHIKQPLCPHTHAHTHTHTHTHTNTQTPYTDSTNRAVSSGEYLTFNE